jgi:DNA-directed RNA polymerase subunit M/transcription elongation factor TFIIS
MTDTETNIKTNIETNIKTNIETNIQNIYPYINKERIFKHSIPLPMEPFYTDINYNKIRRARIIMLSDALGINKDFSALNYYEKIQIICDIEQSCLNETIRKANEHNIRCTWINEQFINLYCGICYTIITCIDDRDIESILIKKIIDKTIDAKKLASIPRDKLCPEKYEEINKKIYERNNIKRELKYSELYFCRSCKKRQCTIEKVQTRSLDENFSLIITCLFCGKSWNG